MIINKDQIELINKISKNKKIVFTNGCFDILHRGHVSYLNAAKACGDILVVGLNTDRSVQILKGPNRPINNQHDRAFLLDNLKSIDFVIFFDEETPLELIKIIKPHILVKGADYKIENVVGADFVHSIGGEVVLIDFVNGYSTTNTIKKMKL